MGGDGGIGDGYSSSTTENDIGYQQYRPSRGDEEEDEEEDEEDDGEEEVEEEEEEEEDDDDDEEDDEDDDEEVDRGQRRTTTAAMKNQSVDVRQRRLVAAKGRGGGGGAGDAHLICDNLKSFNVDINLLTGNHRSNNVSKCAAMEGGGAGGAVPLPPAGVPPIGENSARCRRYKLNNSDDDSAAAIVGVVEIHNNNASNLNK